MDREWLESVLLKNERNESIVKVLNVEYESAVPKGQNYTSKILRVHVTVLLGSGRKSKKTLIAKEMLERNKEFNREFSAFKSEIKVYNNVLGQMEALMQEFEDKNEKLWCSMVGYQPYSLLLLEDLTAQNFKIANRWDCLDLQHSELVLRSLGRYHAMSRILLDRCSVGEDDFQKFYAAVDRPAIKILFESGLRELANVIMTSWPSEWKGIGRQIGQEVNVVSAKLRALYEMKPNTFSVVNHGDAWTCNMLFKYSDNNIPFDVRFIDFQVSHINSYIWDVIYFIHSSIKASIRRKMFNHLLEIYQSSLESSLKFYRYEGNIPTIEDVMSEAKRLEYYAFVTLAIIFPITSASTTDAFKLENLHPPDGKQESAINPEVLKSENYVKNTCEDFDRFAKNGIFCKNLC